MTGCRVDRGYCEKEIRRAFGIEVSVKNHTDVLIFHTAICF